MPRVVIRKRDGAIVYRQSPDFEEGKGIENACVSSGLSPDELEEVELTQEELELKEEAVNAPKRTVRLESERLRSEIIVMDTDTATLEDMRKLLKLTQNRLKALR